MKFESVKESERHEKLGALRNFSAETLRCEQAAALEEIARKCRFDAVLMTWVAGSGHPAGSLSSLDIYNVLLAALDLTPENCDGPDHDRMISSHGHTSPGVYAALAGWGFFDRDDAIPNFRRAGSPYQGHVERSVRGVDWGTGNLGQGLAAGVGFALADRVRGRKPRVAVVMGDGEQPKGENAEARRIAAKEGLSSVTALIDFNHIQISGAVEDVMPTNVKSIWAADGWDVLECSGHDYAELYAALRRADASPRPAVILCHTIMGKGVSFMEGTNEYHGKAPSDDLMALAASELGADPSEMARMRSLRDAPPPKGRAALRIAPSLDLGEPIVYSASDKKDNRSAFGAALADVASRNHGVAGRTPIIAFDCDLAGSVKLDGFSKKFPDRFIQAGIQEHAVATAAGAASTAGVAVVWADFGVFGMDETYNQQRLNDINGAQLKTVLTHVGLDVGEDGMTHQCIDYLGLPRNAFGWKVVVPADPNQTDRATRWMLGEPGNVCLAMGRSVRPVLLNEDGSPFFGEEYVYRYGEIDILRNGEDAVILAMGHLAGAAVEAACLLAARGIRTKVLHSSSPQGAGRDELLSLLGRGPVVTCEDHHADTGLGAVVALHLARAGAAVKMKNLGVARYGESGASSDVIARMGLSPEGIAEAVGAML
ncbi:MAG: transketolase [Synergistaceae bacterium]|nr:transketolase [Synergistaceae bacterium]